MDKQDTENMDLVSLLISSRYRMATIRALLDGPKTPSGVTAFHDGEVAITHVSRSLGELREDDIVDLLVDEERHKGRIYGLTEDGRGAAEDALEVIDGSREGE